MFRLLLTKYRVLVVADLCVLAAVAVAALGLHDVVGAWSSALDSLVTAVSLILFTAVPFAVSFDALLHHPKEIPGSPGWAGWYLGLALNALTAVVSIPLGFLQAGLMARQQGARPEDYLLFLLLGFVFVLWLGGVMGWVGQRAASVLHRLRA